MPLLSKCHFHFFSGPVTEAGRRKNLNVLLSCSFFVVLFNFVVHSKQNRLLVDLTVPVECLVCVDPDNQSPSSQHTVHQLTQLLYNAKESFLEPRATRAVLDHVNRLLEQVIEA